MVDDKLRVYIAGSFRNAVLCREAGAILRDAGFSTYVFCDEGSEAFKHSTAIREKNLINSFTPMSALQNEHIQTIYDLNMTELSQADVVVLILPCGKSAHMEAGWIKGVEGRLIIYGDMLKGEFDAMYGMADLVTNNFDEVAHKLNEYRTMKNVTMLKGIEHL